MTYVAASLILLKVHSRYLISDFENFSSQVGFVSQSKSELNIN
jgi:hypothetical protein